MKDARLYALLTDAEEALSTLSDALFEASDAQWETPPVAKPADDTSERSKGAAPSDPTQRIALDGRRLALRASVVEAERGLERMAVVLRELTSRVESRLTAWGE